MQSNEYFLMNPVYTLEPKVYIGFWCNFVQCILMNIFLNTLLDISIYKGLISFPYLLGIYHVFNFWKRNFKMSFSVTKKTTKAARVYWEKMNSQQIKLLSPFIEEIDGRHVSAANDDDDGAVVGQVAQVEAVGRVEHRQRRPARRFNQHPGIVVNNL